MIRIIQRGLLRDQVAIARQERSALVRTKLAHDRYLQSVTMLGTGAEKMREEAAAGDPFAQGWIACLRLLALTINEARENDT